MKLKITTLGLFMLGTATLFAQDPTSTREIQKNKPTTEVEISDAKKTELVKDRKNTSEKRAEIQKDKKEIAVKKAEIQKDRNLNVKPIQSVNTNEVRTVKGEAKLEPAKTQTTVEGKKAEQATIKSKAQGQAR